MPGGPPGRGQDLARPVDRQGDQPQVRAHGAGRRARRGRDPWPPPYLYRFDAGQDPAEHVQGRRAQSVVPAGRDRQAGHGLLWRSVVGAARGAGSGAEPHVPGPLHRGRLRPVRCDVRGHQQYLEHPAGPAGPDGSDPPVWLHRGREDPHCSRPLAAEADEEQRRQGQRADGGRFRAARYRALLHPRGGRAGAGARGRQDLSQGRQATADQER
ncbi:Uncharacterised protein [Bordetella pertussis]|nr:Uncharacterised protein [Bordetella pertussis]